ncbi:hypothetical protein [Cobetia marina]|uniref:hypothetical protein n=1 Tax=Cobetia marina TaxID=28258 RepID=UPI00384ACCD0
MNSLYLHVGHGKTGSSYLQSILAGSQDNFRRLDIEYPLNNGASRAIQGKVTSGNGNLLAQYNFSNNHNKNIRFLFSSEVLFHDFLSSIGSDLVKKINNLKFTEVKILLFIRDPFDHASSSYQQSIKRGGSTKTINEFLENYSHPALVKQFIKQSRNINNCKLTIKNYTNCKDDIDHVLCDWLEISTGNLVYPENKKVNRSLTKSELYLQREFNKHLGASGDLISDPLCDELPNIESDKFFGTQDMQARVIDRLSDDIKFVNDSIERPKDKYSVYVDEDSLDFSEYSHFDNAQLSVVSRALSQNIMRFDPRPLTEIEHKKFANSIKNKFSNDPANVFRDIALSLENINKLEMAYFFMREASRIRPTGKLIKQKLTDYRNKIDKGVK